MAPVLSILLPSVIPLFVKLVDKIFPSKTGQTKLDVVTQISMAVQNGLQAAKATASTPLTPEQIHQTIQDIVNALNGAGLLKGADTVVSPADLSTAAGIIATAPLANTSSELGNFLIGIGSMILKAGK